MGRGEEGRGGGRGRESMGRGSIGRGRWGGVDGEGRIEAGGGGRWGGEDRGGRREEGVDGEVEAHLILKFGYSLYEALLPGF